MALQMSRMAIFQTAAWRALWIKALTFNRTTLSAIRISLSPNAGTLIATCGGTQLFACGLDRRGEPNSESAGAVDRFAQPFHLQLGASSRSRFGSALSESAGNIPLPAFGGRALCELLADERIVWLRSLIEYLRLMLNIGSYSRAFDFSGNKKRNHSNRTSRAARHENKRSFIRGNLIRPHFPPIGHLSFSRVSSHRRHPFLRPSASARREYPVLCSFARLACIGTGAFNAAKPASVIR